VALIPRLLAELANAVLRTGNGDSGSRSNMRAASASVRDAAASNSTASPLRRLPPVVDGTGVRAPATDGDWVSDLSSELDAWGCVTAGGGAAVEGTGTSVDAGDGPCAPAACARASSSAPAASKLLMLPVGGSGCRGGLALVSADSHA
jgi:hypothetical protein